MVVAQLILLLPFVFEWSLFRVVRDVAGDLEVFFSFFLLLLLLLSELKLLMMVDIGGHHGFLTRTSLIGSRLTKKYIFLSGNRYRSPYILAYLVVVAC